MLTVNKLVAQGRGLAPVLLKRATQRRAGLGRTQPAAASTPPIQPAACSACSCRAARWCAAATCWWPRTARWCECAAAPQPVLVVRHCTEHGSPFDLLRAAYHLGNRHVHIELQA